MAVGRTAPLDEAPGQESRRGAPIAEDATLRLLPEQACLADRNQSIDFVEALQQIGQGFAGAPHEHRQALVLVGSGGDAGDRTDAADRDVTIAVDQEFEVGEGVGRRLGGTGLRRELLMLDVSGCEVPRQQFGEPVARLLGDPLQHEAQIRLRIESVELGRLQ